MECGTPDTWDNFHSIGYSLFDYADICGRFAEIINDSYTAGSGNTGNVIITILLQEVSW